MLILGGVLLPAGAALAQATPATCSVPAFRGATTPQGADAEMHIINTGQPCTIINYGMFAEKRNPAYAGAITKAPTAGDAAFKPPRAVYTPKPGYVGDDYFEYEANAKGPSENVLLFRVRVKVSVKAASPP